MLCDSFRLSWVSISIAIVDCEIQNCWCSVATSIMHWLLRLVFCTRQRHKFIIYLMSTLTIKKMPSTLSIVFIYVQPETKKSVHVLDAWQKPHEPPEFRNKSHWTTNNVLLNMTLQICISLSCLTHPLCVLWLKFQFSMLHSANGTAISRKTPSRILGPQTIIPPHATNYFVMCDVWWCFECQLQAILQYISLWFSRTQLREKNHNPSENVRAKNRYITWYVNAVAWYFVWHTLLSHYNVQTECASSGINAICPARKCQWWTSGE